MNLSDEILDRYGKLEYAGFQAVTVAATAIGLTMSTVDAPHIAVIDIETANIRYRADGTDPTASVGTPAFVGDRLVIDDIEEMSNLKMIRTGSTSAVASVTYYKAAD